jgi:hypothetical protein
MSFTQSTIRTQFASLIDMSPNKLTVTIEGDDYDAVKTNLNRDFRYTDYGLQNDYRFSVIISVSDFTTLPAPDSEATVGGTVYRVLGVESDSTDVGIRLDLGQRYA